MKNKIKKHYSEDELIIYLENKYNSEYLSLVSKNHIDSCKECWNLWNKVRWDKARLKDKFYDLKEYLNDEFVEYYDSSWFLASEWNEKNPSTDFEIADFYKKTENYLFNLVVWHESGDRGPMHEHLLKLINKFNVESIIDFGCGVGSDSLYLLENNIQTYMCDYICPSTDFLKWRVKKRHLLNGIFLDTEKINALPKVDMFWAIDVLEHIPDPIKVINMLSDDTKVFVHHSEFSNQSNGRHPCHLNFEEKKLNSVLKDNGFVNIPWERLSVWVKKDLLD